MIYHFVVGDLAAEPLRTAVLSEPSMQGDVIVLKDILHVGPLHKEEGQGFSTLRTTFWKELITQEKNFQPVDDMERLLEVSAAMYKNEELKAWFWMAPGPADVNAYYWLLPYLSKHKDRFLVVNIAGLPFLDESGKVYYPKSLSQILPKELIKARRLARVVTPSEMELDSDEWERLVSENGGIRTFEGGKKLTSRPADHYDNQLLSFCSRQFQKASKVVRQVLSKYGIPTGDVYLGWRLRQLAAEGMLLLQGDGSKALNEFDVRFSGEISADTEVTPPLADPPASLS